MNSDLAVTPADEWCKKQFEAWDVAQRVVSDLQLGTGMLGPAKLKRAERLLAIADARANAAECVRILKESTPTGEIIIDIPAAETKVRIKW
jgi:hypothetical protein